MSFGPIDFANYVRLRNLLDGFQMRTLKYCSSPSDPQVRDARINEIRAALTGNGELPPEVNLATGCPVCDENEHCEGGACVPNTAYLVEQENSTSLE